MKASKLTARGLAYVLRAVGRKIAKAHREAQTPHGKTGSSASMPLNNPAHTNAAANSLYFVLIHFSFLVVFLRGDRTVPRAGAVVIEHSRIGNGLPQRELERPVLAANQCRLDPAICEQNVQLSGNVE